MEQSSDGGNTWTIPFDGICSRAKERTDDELIAALTSSAAAVEKSPDPSRLPNLIAAEKFFQAGASGPPGDSGLDLGWIESFLLTLANHPKWKRAFPVADANLDAYQWFTLAVHYSRNNLPSPLRAWVGQWRGEGTFEGKAARIEVALKPIPATGEPFLGRAVYTPGAAAATWHDSVG
ncbi:MAG: hypothetical protein ACKV2U_12705 [Bryobacteraceae bacterium]